MYRLDPTRIVRYFLIPLFQHDQRARFEQALLNQLQYRHFSLLSRLQLAISATRLLACSYFLFLRSFQFSLFTLILLILLFSAERLKKSDIFMAFQKADQVYFRLVVH